MPSRHRGATTRPAGQVRESTLQDQLLVLTSYGYIRCRSLTGISVVGDADGGYPLMHMSRFDCCCSWIGNTILGGIFAPLSFIMSAVRATRICELPEV